MLTRLDIEALNKELGQAVRLAVAKFEKINKGVVILGIITEREPSQDGHSIEYSIKIRAQAVKEVTEETAP